MTARVGDPSVYNDFSGLASLKRDAQAQDPQALREVAKQFESLFTRMMLKSMREASFGDSLLGSDQQDFYQGMFDDQLSMELSKGRGLGLADVLVRQLTHAASPTGAPDGPSSGSGSGPGNGPVSGPGNAPDTGSAAGAAPNAWNPSSKEEFVRDLWPAAQQAGQELGIDPRNLLAQAALESNWGRSMPQDAQGRSSCNLFGVKASGSGTGKSVAANTLEVENGVTVNRRQRFRAYDSPVESFHDYVALLRDNPRYAEALNTGSDAQAFGLALQRGGYATDPAYAQKVAAIAQNLDHSSRTLKSADNLPINPVKRTL